MGVRRCALTSIKYHLEQVGATGRLPLHDLSSVVMFLKSDVTAPFRVGKDTRAKVCGYQMAPPGCYSV